ncbi:lytic transglycosylase domain-containing protein [Luteimonas saliphila]|uniref:lytic transglycosylase domain-containing protein n=1 Tax=Luteimonas saliphila TaxID=2804919 RepID=UPI00192E2465|nr:lytic transglycosylase domain-containing protein [Luteimonas saliphila]
MSRIAVALLLAACTAGPAHACGIAQWQPHIAEASRKYAVPEAWIRAVMRAESAGCTHLDGRPTTSHAGAMGLMQLMPATWAELRAKHSLGDDPHDPRENILAGTAYLREMHDRFGVPSAFAAYHAGPGRYAVHLTHGTPLPAETHRYVAQVSAGIGLTDATIVAEQGGESHDPLFALTARRRNDEALEHDARLFVRLRHAQASRTEPNR